MAEIKRMIGEVYGLTFDPEVDGTIVKFLVKNAPPIGKETGVLILGDAPASTAPKDLIEKYARSITNNNSDIFKSFEADEVSPVARDILTRFAAELQGAEVDDVWFAMLRYAEIEDLTVTEIPVTRTMLYAAIKAGKEQGE